VPWPSQDIRVELFESVVHESTIRLPTSPTCIVTLVQYYCTIIRQCTTRLPISRLYAKHHTILVITISCKGQLGLYKTFVCLYGDRALINTFLCTQHLLYFPLHCILQSILRNTWFPPAAPVCHSTYNIRVGIGNIVRRTTAMQMLPLLAATSVEHRGP